MDAKLSRRAVAVPATRDIEKDPLLPTDDADKEDKPKTHQETFSLVLSTPAFVLALLMILWFTLGPSAHSTTFPFPRPSPSKLPRFVEEGIEQCKVAQRGVGEMKWDKERKENDRWVDERRAQSLRPSA